MAVPAVGRPALETGASGGFDSPRLHVISIAVARYHWRDRESPCNVAQFARDEVWRWYWAHRYDPDHGRRWRGRVLSRANMILHQIRVMCPTCRETVEWESGWFGRGRGDCPNRDRAGSWCSEMGP